MTLSTCSRRTPTRWWWSRTTCCPHGQFGSRNVTHPAIAVRPGPADADQVQPGTCLKSISSPIADARGLRVYRSVRRLRCFVKQGLFRARQLALRMVLEIQTAQGAARCVWLLLVATKEEGFNSVFCLNVPYTVHSGPLVCHCSPEFRPRIVDPSTLKLK